MKAAPSQVIAGCFALCSFAVALVAGLSVENEAGTILLRAVAIMIVCYPVGLLAGFICERAVNAEVDAAATATATEGPSPTLSTDPDPVEQNVENEEILIV